MGGGSQTSETKIPEWLSSAAKSALGRANTVAGIGPTPYYGPDVAALSPLQEAARANLGAGASAFGLAPAASSGLPEAQTFAGGVRGYSSAPLYEAAVNELKTRYPGQYNAIMGQFIDPVTGALPSWLQPTAAAQPTASAMQPTSARSDRSAAEIAALAPSKGPYKSLYDMRDGGGPGYSGVSFKGGPLSNTLNKLGVKPAPTKSTFRGGR